MQIKSIVILGTGNLAWHWLNVLKDSEIKVLQVYGRNEDMLKTLVNEYTIPFTSDLKKIDANADLYLICVSDHAVSELASQLKIKRNAIVAHTAGSVDLNVLKFTSDQYGVIYPLQTFTKNQKIDFQATPVFIEGSNKLCTDTLIHFASIFGKQVKVLNSNDRIKLHLTAVITANFFNHLNTLAYDYLKDNVLEKYYADLLPLLQTSLDKLESNIPNTIQTGPAKRNDEITIQKHLHLLIDNQELKALYQVLSDSIIKYYQKENIAD
jgi:predicted short-subunit dehydrogenase-like oxidoreductase (DUF2520 family)